MFNPMVKKALKYRFPIILVIALHLILPQIAHSDGFKDVYYRFDRWAANFDPMGNALTPLNEVPGLKVNGLFYQWSYFNVHSDETVGHREKDWNIQQLQCLGEIHTRYQFAPKMALAAKFHYHYDGVYDVESSSLYADNPDAFRTNSWDEFLREFYLDIEMGNWFMKFGKQQQAWGKMEGRWMDFINSMDKKDGPQIRSFYYNELRIPLWMSNITYAFGKNSVQVLWIPDFEPDLSPYPGSVWYPPLRSDPRKSSLYRGDVREPGGGFENHQWGVRFDTKISQATWSLGYMYGFSPVETRFIRQDEKGLLFYDPEFARCHYVGTALDFDYVFKNIPLIERLPLVFRTEAIYSPKQYFLDSDKWDSSGHSWVSGNGFSEDETLSGSSQFKFFFPSRVTITYQPMYSYICGWKESFGTNRWSLIHLFILGKWFESFENRLNLTLYAYFNTGGPVNDWQGTKMQLIGSYRISDYIELKLGYTDYGGSTVDAYGQYDLWDNVGWEIVYNF
jgi:hypothetical protein